MRIIFLFIFLLSVFMGCQSQSGGQVADFSEETPKTKVDSFIFAGTQQYGVTTHYDGSYQRLDYPMGDVPIETGVCTDVVIRAMRRMDIDLQQDIHLDMKAYFQKYPKKWGMTKPDPNIDHRRVPNMQTYFRRKGWAQPISSKGEDYLPGDLVVWKITDSMLHIGIVTNRKISGTNRHYIVHNVGGGVEISDWLFAYPIIDHFRIF